MINLLFGGNSKVFDGLLIAALSAAKHTDCPLKIYVMTMDLRDVDERYSPLDSQNIAVIEAAVKRYNPQNEVILLDMTAYFRSEFMESKNLNTSYTPYTLLRLFSDRDERIPMKILYLDTDVIVCRNLSELYNTDISNYEFGGVRDFLGRYFIGRKYINAGVLLLNMQRIRQTGLFTKAREMCRTRKLAFPDQDALNKLCTEKLILDDRFNSQSARIGEPVIRHFSKTIRWLPFFHTINIKPWQINEVHSVLKTTDYDEILNEYLSIKSSDKGEILK